MGSNNRAPTKNDVTLTHLNVLCNNLFIISTEVYAYTCIHMKMYAYVHLVINNFALRQKRSPINIIRPSLPEGCVRP